jgi:hypothetical protein
VSESVETTMAGFFADNDVIKQTHRNNDIEYNMMGVGKDGLERNAESKQKLAP